MGQCVECDHAAGTVTVYGGIAVAGRAQVKSMAVKAWLAFGVAQLLSTQTNCKVRKLNSLHSLS